MDWSQLRQISELKFRQSEQAMSKLKVRETSLRSELARLQSLAQETHAQPASDSELRAIGADIIWLKWIENSRRKLNIELAQVLALKEDIAARHRKTNGEKLVTEALSEKQRLGRQRLRRERTLNQAIETSLTQSAFSSLDAQSRR
ncbi:hypothetical protein [Tateyamaria omphalii]|uniref:hypothetical protein n=1 Tax=Tateyamaria omphalii TaxID=299262 RepID=UPI00167AF82A|nr:hypothetical protein [Tateyamaria omphalii]